MNYSGFNKVDMENGEGVRVSLFVSGCPFNCKGCFNQEARHLEAGLLFDETMLEEVLQALDKDYISGLSLLGGDPLHPHNREDVLRLCVLAKRRFPDKSNGKYTVPEGQSLKEEAAKDSTSPSLQTDRKR